MSPISTAAIVLMATPAIPSQAPSTAVAAPRPAARDLAGRWTGQFAQADWTFELRRQNGGWSGRYSTTKSGTWRPLKSLVVAGDTVKLGIESQPQIDFDLTLGPDGRTLSGSIVVAGHASLPFTAVRES